MRRTGRLRRLTRRLGYSGLVLGVFGWFWFWIGVGVIARPDYDQHLIHTHLPIWARVALWCVCGAASMVLAWFRPAHNIGFALLFIPPAERAISYCVALFAGPNLQWVVGAAVWSSMTLAVVLFAAWPEPPDRTEHAP